MTIGIDGSRAFVSNRTGTENYSYQLIRALAGIQIENKHSLRSDDTENIYLIYIKQSQKSEVRSQKWPENFSFKVISLPRLWTQAGLALRTFIDPIDVLFIPSHTLPLIRNPWLKTVITVHDLGAEYLPAFHQLKQILYLKLMTHYQLKTASSLIAVSEATKKDLISRVGLESKKIKVVYEGIDNSVFKKLSNDILNTTLIKYKLQKNKYFFFVGTIQPRKNLERLIKAFEVSKLKDKGFKLVIAGGMGWKSDSIYSLPKELGIEDSVSFLGRVSEVDMVALYNGACALTYPSLFEGFGLPILEAFACECPVITSNVSSLPEIAGKAAILVDPYNIEGISNALISLASDNTLRNSLIKKGIYRYSYFSWKKAAEKTLEVIKVI